MHNKEGQIGFLLTKIFINKISPISLDDRKTLNRCQKQYNQQEIERLSIETLIRLHLVLIHFKKDIHKSQYQTNLINQQKFHFLNLLNIKVNNKNSLSKQTKYQSPAQNLFTAILSRSFRKIKILLSRLYLSKSTRN